MGFLDRLLGRDETPDRATQNAGAPARSDDEIAVERYRYLLRTAPPETIEQVHAEAFEKLTPEQRQMVFDDLSSNAPQGEAPRDSSPAGLASAATRSELRQPGTLERSFGGGAAGGGRGPGFGSMVGGSLLGTVAGYVIGSAIVSSFLPPMDGGAGEAGSEGDAGTEGDAGSGGDAGSDAGGWDASGGDAGGGDFGGGDFGGGDFGF
ncbi:hypothetical protein ELQ90_13765 [Labedella phragmitis]|uniref:Uncharacterized protein n=1 Tax=Labedella phragmitis TaxID=2498849 RepID=A0A3S3ZWX8_9MICO|nr:hypothetical protein [Labedella phragmitis]RWZ46514.1 hypothetical protein ELQ90_13765 [Labedella phragmitis]